MIKSKKQMFIVVGAFLLVLTLFTTTYAFFNYTRTGTTNTIRVGRISFNSSQSGNVNLTNAFPITSEEAETDTTNAKSTSITITGDTDYSNGVEYLVTASDVNLRVNNKELPIALEISVTGNNNKTLGTLETGDYYTNRDNYSVSKYKTEYNGKLNEGSHILVGYIAPNTTSGTIEGINGVITIKAYIDKEQILISDTYNNGNTPTDDLGTPASMGEGKVVFTTTEWNSIQSSETPLSFKVKVEANEGIWVDPESTSVSCFEKRLIKAYNINKNMTQTELNDCISYFNNLEYSIDNNGTAEDYCLGTGTSSGMTFQEALDRMSANYNYNIYLENHNIIIPEYGVDLFSYDNSCGTDIVIPSMVEYTRLLHNSNISSEEVTACVNFLTDNDGPELEGQTVDNGETYQAFCDGTGTKWGETFQNYLDRYFYDSDEEYEILKSENIIVEETANYPVLEIGGYSMLNVPDTIINHVVFNSNLRFINHLSFYEPLVFPKNIVIPASVRYIGYSAFIFKDNSEGITIPNSSITILGNPFVDDGALPAFESIQYGGSCQELIRYTDWIIQSKKYTYNEVFYVNTTDNNACEVRNGFYD